MFEAVRATSPEIHKELRQGISTQTACMSLGLTFGRVSTNRGQSEQEQMHVENAVRSCMDVSELRSFDAQ